MTKRCQLISTKHACFVFSSNSVWDLDLALKKMKENWIESRSKDAKRRQLIFFQKKTKLVFSVDRSSWKSELLSVRHQLQLHFLNKSPSDHYSRSLDSQKELLPVRCELYTSVYRCTFWRSRFLAFELCSKKTSQQLWSQNRAMALRANRQLSANTRPRPQRESANSSLEKRAP